MYSVSIVVFEYIKDPIFLFVLIALPIQSFAYSAFKSFNTCPNKSQKYKNNDTNPAKEHKNYSSYS